MMLDPLAGRRQVIDLKALNPRTDLDAKVAVTLTDKLRHAKLITHDEWHAARRLRELYHAVHDRPSEGVSRYDPNPPESDGATRADRRAEQLIRTGESKGNLHKQLTDALFAMAGYTATDGSRAMVPRAVQLMVRAIIDSETPMRQGEVGEVVSLYKPGARNRQVGAAGTTWVRLHLWWTATQWRDTWPSSSPSARAPGQR